MSENASASHIAYGSQMRSDRDDGKYWNEKEEKHIEIIVIRWFDTFQSTLNAMSTQYMKMKPRTSRYQKAELLLELKSNYDRGWFNHTSIT